SDSAHPGLLVWNVPSGQLTTNPVAVTITVSDSHGHITAQSFTLTVVPDVGDRAPSIVSSYRTTVQLGQTYAYQVVGSDPARDPLGSVVDSATAPDGGARAGVSLDPVTGLLPWVPRGPEFGLDHIVLHVGDGRGLSSPAQDCAIQVLTQASNGAPTITTLPP